MMDRFRRWIIQKSMVNCSRQNDRIWCNVVLFLFSCAFIYLLLWLQTGEPPDVGITGSIVLAAGVVWLNLIVKDEARVAPDEHSILKERAMRPAPPAVLQSEQPEGILFGRYRGSYIRRNLMEDGHVFVTGGSGSGKSSRIAIPNLLINRPAFAVDIKGELSFKSARLTSHRVAVIDPADRRQCGYNPFYALVNHKKSTQQEILSVMKTVAFSLVSKSASHSSDPYWKDSARNLCIGLFIYFFNQGKTNIVDIVDAILARRIDKTIAVALGNSSPSSNEYRYLVQFDGLPMETLGGVFTELANHLQIFSTDQEIRYMLKDNDRKANPRLLERKTSVFLSVREEKLADYYDLIQLIINQTLNELSLRPEDSDPVLVILDELPRLVSAGRIDALLDGARTLRSRRVSLILISQSLESLSTAYTEGEIDDLINNCLYKVILSSSSRRTQQDIIAWAGKYKERKRSFNGGGQGRRTSVSFEDEDIVTASELMTLPLTDELLLISPYGYFRLQQVKYYEDPILKQMSDEIIEYNRVIREAQERAAALGIEDVQENRP